jgi:hypothetical protein
MLKVNTNKELKMRNKIESNMIRVFSNEGINLTAVSWCDNTLMFVADSFADAKKAEKLMESGGYFCGVPFRSVITGKWQVPVDI